MIWAIEAGNGSIIVEFLAELGMIHGRKKCLELIPRVAFGLSRQPLNPHTSVRFPVNVAMPVANGQEREFCSN